LTDKEFDDLARNALAVDSGTSNGVDWASVRPHRKTWLPTVPETLMCGCACGLALFLIGGLGRRPEPASASNVVVERAMRDDVVATLWQVSRVPGISQR
jgi:hypothetical protein